MKKAPAKNRSAESRTTEARWLKPSPTKRLKVVAPDGTILEDAAAQKLGSWPSVRLRVVFDTGFVWWRFRETPWHEAAIATASTLASVRDWSWISENISDKSQPPVLHAIAYDKKKAAALFARTLFLDGRGHLPWTMLRSGDELSVQYDASFVVTAGSLSLHLPPTPSNAALLERTLDGLASRVAFAYADVSHALAGFSTAVALDWHQPRRHEVYVAAQLDKLERAAPGLGAPWLLWVGERWRESPAKQRITQALSTGASRQVQDKGGLIRIALSRPRSPDDAAGARAGKKLAADVQAATKKLLALQTRELMRRGP